MELFDYLKIFASGVALTVMFLSAAEEIKELWSEYENNSSIEANLVKDFDKVRIIDIRI